MPANGQPVSSDGLANIRTIIENRLGYYGFVSPDVQTQGTDRIVVQFPATADVQQVRVLVSSTGRLDFVEVPPARASEVVVGESIPPDLAVIFSGDQIATASAGTTQTGQRAVDLTFRAEGAQLFDQHAAAHFGEQFAIVLDGIVVSAPIIRATRFDGKAQISGAFETQDDVSELVTVLMYGALPNALEEVSFGPCPAQ